MHGTQAMSKALSFSSKRLLVTPEMAVKLLESNNTNRPLTDGHVKMIAEQIRDGRWKFNGDTIKISASNDVLDGQHRLWAVVDSQIAIDTILVTGIEPDAFATIDTLRKTRSGSDTLARMGLARHRKTAAAALGWLLRYQRGVLTKYRSPENKIHNADIEEAFGHHPQIEKAAERADRLRGLANPGIMCFFYYVVTNQNEDLAEVMMHSLEDPTGIPINNPFYRLRGYFTSDHHKQKDPIVTIAVAIKAVNAAYRNQEMKVLNWKSIGKASEDFPKLAVSGSKAPKKGK